MKIIEEKRSSLSLLALLFGIIFAFIAFIEFLLIGLEAVTAANGEEISILFFTSPGDAVFESSFLDHIMKGFVNLLIGALFLYGYPKIKGGTLEGFSFLIGGALLALGLAFLFISIWVANLIDTALIGISEPEIWDEFIFTDGIRFEWFLGVASIYILLIWKKRENYLK